MRCLGRGHVSRLLETTARLEQVLGQIASGQVDTKTFEQATAVDDGTAGLPERTTFARARLVLTLRREAKRAALGLDLVHDSSL